MNRSHRRAPSAASPRRGRTGLAGWLVLALIATACGSSASPSGSPAGSGPTGSGPDGQQTGSQPLRTPGVTGDAASLADAVVDAGDDAAREAAILDVLAGANIGVYGPDGAPIQAGGERGEQDFWIYDFEVTGLAAAVRDGDRVALDAIGADLAELVTSAGGPAATSSEITAAVLAGARSVAADPTQPRAFALAAAIELGRHDPDAVDLSTATASDGVALDPLAAFLVTADLVLPFVEAAPPPAAADLRLADASGELGMIAAATCPSPPIGGRSGWIAGVNASRFPNLASVPNASFDRYLQGRLVGATVESKLTGDPAFHWTHEDHDGNADPDVPSYVFSLRVRTPGPAQAIQCGTLSGATLPPAGEIVGANVTWMHPRLEKHGTLTEDDQTFAQGKALLEVDPNVERYPSGIGPERKETIKITARANVFKALGGDLYTRLAGVPAIQQQSVDVDVSWHRSYDVEVEITSILTMTRGVTYKGELGVTTGEGTIKVKEYFDAYAGHTYEGIVNPGELTTSATAAATKGNCNTEWITEAGGSRKIDWQVLALDVYPVDRLYLALDTGPNTNEQPDSYDGLICPPGGGGTLRLGPSPGNVWESLIFRSYPNGIGLRGVGPNKWTIDTSDDPWSRGGDLATWHSQEACGGYCSGFLDVVVRIKPLPGP